MCFRQIPNGRFAVFSQFQQGWIGNVVAFASSETQNVIGIRQGRAVIGDWTRSVLWWCCGSCRRSLTKGVNRRKAEQNQNRCGMANLALRRYLGFTLGATFHVTTVSSQEATSQGT